MARDELDRYYTPDALASAIVAAMIDELGEPRCFAIRRVAEPSVGGGAFVRAFAPYGPRSILAVDVDPDAPGLRGRVVGHCGDWLDEDAGWPDGGNFDLVIGNPPYRNAEAHIRASLDRAPLVCLLLRASILGGQARHALWRHHPPRRVWSVVGRPSFTGGGTDSSEYVVVLWDRYWTDEPRLGWLTWRERAAEMVVDDGA